MLPLRHCDIATTDQTHWHLIQSLVRCGKRRAFVRMSHVHILKIIVHGHPVQYQTRTVLLLYWCMVANKLPAVSSPVCDGGCLIALCCDRRAPTGSPVQTFDHAVQCRLAFVCFEKGKCRRIRHTAWCQILQPFWHQLRLQPPLQFAPTALNAAAKPQMLQNDALRTSIAYFEAGIEILVKNCPTKHFHMMPIEFSSFRERFVFETTKTSQATRQLCLTSHNDPEWRFWRQKRAQGLI